MSTNSLAWWQATKCPSVISLRPGAILRHSSIAYRYRVLKRWPSGGLAGMGRSPVKWVLSHKLGDHGEDWKLLLNAQGFLCRHRFPPVITKHAIWLYFRFPLSFRDVEEMMAKRGIEVSYETVRRWVLKFGPAFAANIKTSGAVRRMRTSLSFLHLS